MGAAFKAIFQAIATLFSAFNHLFSAADLICTIGHEQAEQTLKEFRAQSVHDLAALKAELALNEPVVVIGKSKAVVA